MKTPLVVLMSLLVAASLAAQMPSSLDSLYLKNKTYAHQVALWSVYKTQRADVVMLGNSITQGTNWSELLGRPGIINRGIGGDNLAGFLHRMQYVTALRPRFCFVMGGINDIYTGFPVDQIIRNYSAVIDTLVSAGITPVVQSTLFVSPKWRDADTKNLIVAELNSRLQALCNERSIRFLNVARVLCSEGRLRDEYTTDGVHLTAAAYAAWSEQLDAFLREKGL